MNSAARNAKGAGDRRSHWADIPCTLDEGPSPRAAIGLMVLTADIVIEGEMRAFLPRERVSLYTARIHKDLGKPVVTITQALAWHLPASDRVRRTGEGIRPAVDHLAGGLGGRSDGSVKEMHDLVTAAVMNASYPFFVRKITDSRVLLGRYPEG